MHSKDLMNYYFPNVAYGQQKKGKRVSLIIEMRVKLFILNYYRKV